MPTGARWVVHSGSQFAISPAINVNVVRIRALKGMSTRSADCKIEDGNLRRLCASAPATFVHRQLSTRFALAETSDNELYTADEFSGIDPRLLAANPLHSSHTGARHVRIDFHRRVRGVPVVPHTGHTRS